MWAIRVVPHRYGPVSWLVMRLPVRFSALLAVVASLALAGGIRVQAQSTSAQNSEDQTPANVAYAPGNPLSGVRYDNRFDMSLGMA
jgi:hypothetical protein